MSYPLVLRVRRGEKVLAFYRPTNEVAKGIRRSGEMKIVRKSLNKHIKRIEKCAEDIISLPPCSTSETGRESACILSTDERSSQGGKVEHFQMLKSANGTKKMQFFCFSPLTIAPIRVILTAKGG